MSDNHILDDWNSRAPIHYSFYKKFGWKNITITISIVIIFLFGYWPFYIMANYTVTEFENIIGWEGGAEIIVFSALGSAFIAYIYQIIIYYILVHQVLKYLNKIGLSIPPNIRKSRNIYSLFLFVLIMLGLFAIVALDNNGDMDALITIGFLAGSCCILQAVFTLRSLFKIKEILRKN